MGPSVELVRARIPGAHHLMDLGLEMERNELVANISRIILTLHLLLRMVPHRQNHPGKTISLYLLRYSAVRRGSGEWLDAIVRYRTSRRRLIPPLFPTLPLNLNSDEAPRLDEVQGVLS
jgi:hypothetical protein